MGMLPPRLPVEPKNKPHPSPPPPIPKGGWQAHQQRPQKILKPSDDSLLYGIGGFILGRML